MARHKLNSITWPNMPNDTYYLDADKVEYDDTETYSEGSVGDALQNKANIDGSYENLTAGNAEQIVTDIRANDQTPYLFRTAGGSVDIGDREYINGIVGGTVAWNQLVKNGNFESASLWANGFHGTGLSIANGIATYTATGVYAQIASSFNNAFLANHVYMSLAVAKASTARKASLGTTALGQTYADIGTAYTMVGSVKKPSTSFTEAFIFAVSTAVDGDVINVKSLQCFDLTAMFGSTIADYIYSLEQANAGAGVAWFKKLFPKPYYAYNAGELMSVKALRHITRGFNAFDVANADLQQKNWENIYTVSQNVHTEGYTKVIGGATYCFHQNIETQGRYIRFYDANYNFLESETISIYNNNDYIFTVPANAMYLRLMWYDANGVSVAEVANGDICINLSWDGERDGEYEEYVEHVYELDSDLELRGIPKLTAGNDLYYDGDVYEPDGTVTRKYGIVDLGTLNWSYNSSSLLFYTGINDAVKSANTGLHGVCSKYRCVVGYNPTGGINDTTQDKAFSIGSSFITAGNNLLIRDTAYTDPEQFKTAMSGVYLVYELATPTTETADPYTSPQIVNDFGTEEFVISNTVAVPIPVGHNTDYPINLKAKVEMMPNSPEGDGDYIVRQTNGTNEYVSIANNATISGLVSRSPVASGADGTYVLKATISGGTVTYSWEAE